MKKILFLACLLAATFCAQAQTSSFVVRSGNIYTVDGVSMNKQLFMNNYLRSHDQVIYQDFNRAYKLSNAGWGLFGGGLGLEIIGAVISRYYSNRAGSAISVIGSCATISGIVCLGVGYGRMHRSADLYNIQVQQKYKAQLSFTGNGLALAW